MQNVNVYDNGSAFIVTVDGLITSAYSSLGNAWRHIVWMYAIASQKFTVGKSKTPVKVWIEEMKKQGYLTKEDIHLAYQNME